MPLCAHPTNSNGVICYDLSVDPSPLLTLSSDEIAERVFTRTQDLPEGMERIPLKSIHLNKSPMVANLSVLDAAAAARLNIDRARCEEHWQRLMARINEVCGKASDVMARDLWQDVVAVPDPEFRLYGGFLTPRDRQLCEQVRRLPGEELAARSFPFQDDRLQELLFRYRARNFPATLSEDEQHQWEEHRYARLNEKLCDGYIDIESYHRKIGELAARTNLDARQRQVLADLDAWGEHIL